MCIVIDTCCIANVLDTGNKDHDAFKPVWRWINNGKGRMIMGGTKYGSELSKMGNYLGVLSELKKRGRVVSIERKLVDDEATRIKGLASDRDFDDEHLAALISVTRCRVICTNDKRAVKFLKDKSLYRKGVSPPFIYKNRQHSDLCCTRHVVPACY